MYGTAKQENVRFVILPVTIRTVIIPHLILRQENVRSADIAVAMILMKTRNAKYVDLRNAPHIQSQPETAQLSLR